MPSSAASGRFTTAKRLAVPVLVAAAFAVGFLARGTRAPAPAARVEGPGFLSAADAARDLEKAKGIGRYLGVVREVREDAVVVSAPDGPGPDARQRPVTLRIGPATRLNSRLKAGIVPSEPPEEGGEPLTLAELRPDDLVGFTGGSPFDATDIDAATVTLLARPPSASP